jgi:hypothetical protein
LTRDQYTDVVDAVNERLKPSRSGMIDGVLLMTGPLILPLAWWGVRHRNQTRRRKRLLKKAISEFSAHYPTLYMWWNRQPESKLTIERKGPLEEESHPQQEQQQQQQDIHVMAEAQFVSDVIAPAQPIPTVVAAANEHHHHHPPVTTTPNAVGHAMVL